MNKRNFLEKYKTRWITMLSVLSLVACVAPQKKEGESPISNPPVHTRLEEKQAPEESFLPKNKDNCVFYATGETALPESAHAMILKQAKRLKADPKIALSIVGYTDDLGSGAYNLAVAQKRVDAVYNHFRKLGIDRKKLRLYPVGSEKSQCSDDACRQLMRRVELEEVKY